MVPDFMAPASDGVAKEWLVEIKEDAPVAQVPENAHVFVPAKGTVRVVTSQGSRVFQGGAVGAWVALRDVAGAGTAPVTEGVRQLQNESPCRGRTAVVEPAAGRKSFTEAIGSGGQDSISAGAIRPIRPIVELVGIDIDNETRIVINIGDGMLIRLVLNKGDTDVALPDSLLSSLLQRRRGDDIFVQIGGRNLKYHVLSADEELRLERCLNIVRAGILGSRLSIPGDRDVGTALYERALFGAGNTLSAYGSSAYGRLPVPPDDVRLYPAHLVFMHSALATGRWPADVLVGRTIGVARFGELPLGAGSQDVRRRVRGAFDASDLIALHDDASERGFAWNVVVNDVCRVSAAEALVFEAFGLFAEARMMWAKAISAAGDDFGAINQVADLIMARSHLSARGLGMDRYDADYRNHIVGGAGPTHSLRGIITIGAASAVHRADSVPAFGATAGGGAVPSVQVPSTAAASSVIVERGAPDSHGNANFR